MATLTTNLFRGQGERDHRLEVVEGHWPTDLVGDVFVVGPDKRAPGGHWFAEQGLVQKTHLVPDADGRILVEHRVVRTPVACLRERFGFLFKRLQFMELSPFGVSNLANTNVQGIDGRSS
jgi:carotenoid cleavage dioxygenase-like enzyme